MFPGSFSLDSMESPFGGSNILILMDYLLLFILLCRFKKNKNFVEKMMKIIREE
jgi:hypothetical protein